MHAPRRSCLYLKAVNRCFPLLLFLLTAIAPCRPLSHAGPAKPDRANAAGSPAPAIVCFGDSITAGYGVEPGHSYPDYLQADLDSRGYHYRVVNQGVSGNTTKDGLERVQDMLQTHPAIVIVEFGGNDGLRGIPITATRANLDQIVAAVQNAGAKPVLLGITLPPNYGPDYIRQFSAIFTQVAASHHIPLLPMLYSHVYDVSGAIQDDGIHPTAKGAQLIAGHILPVLLPLLHKSVK